MSSRTIEFAKYLLGIRGAATSDSPEETALLARLARECRTIVEVGVFEGVASVAMARAMPGDGTLYLVDPYFAEVRVERLLGFSMARFIAVRELRGVARKVRFIRDTSAGAARSLALQGRCDLVFIDARHDYQSVCEDFQLWWPMLRAGGLMAFHDSRECPRRPDLHPDVGSVRLLREIEEGRHGDWVRVEAVDSLTVIRRGKAAP